MENPAEALRIGGVFVLSVRNSRSESDALAIILFIVAGEPDIFGQNAVAVDISGI